MMNRLGTQEPTLQVHYEPKAPRQSLSLLAQHSPSVLAQDSPSLLTQEDPVMLIQHVSSLLIEQDPSLLNQQNPFVLTQHIFSLLTQQDAPPLTQQGPEMAPSEHPSQASPIAHPEPVEEMTCQQVIPEREPLEIPPETSENVPHLDFIKLPPLNFKKPKVSHDWDLSVCTEPLVLSTAEDTLVRKYGVDKPCETWLGDNQSFAKVGRLWPVREEKFEKANLLAEQLEGKIVKFMGLEKSEKEQPTPPSKSSTKACNYGEGKVGSTPKFSARCLPWSQVSESKSRGEENQTFKKRRGRWVEGLGEAQGGSKEKPTGAPGGKVLEDTLHGGADRLSAGAKIADVSSWADAVVKTSADVSIGQCADISKSQQGEGAHVSNLEQRGSADVSRCECAEVSNDQKKADSQNAADVSIDLADVSISQKTDVADIRVITFADVSGAGADVSKGGPDRCHEKKRRRRGSLPDPLDFPVPEKRQRKRPKKFDSDSETETKFPRKRKRVDALIKDKASEIAGNCKIAVKENVPPGKKRGRRECAKLCVFCGFGESLSCGMFYGVCCGVELRGCKCIGGSSNLVVHEMCALFAGGVYHSAENSEFPKLEGLHEAAKKARGRKVCSHCGVRGPSMGCRVAGCSRAYHYTCALLSGSRLADCFDLPSPANPDILPPYPFTGLPLACPRHFDVTGLVDPKRQWDTQAKAVLERCPDRKVPEWADFNRRSRMWVKAPEAEDWLSSLKEWAKQEQQRSGVRSPQRAGVEKEEAFVEKGMEKEQRSGVRIPQEAEVAQQVAFWEDGNERSGVRFSEEEKMKIEVFLGLEHKGETDQKQRLGVQIPETEIVKESNQEIAEGGERRMEMLPFEDIEWQEVESECDLMEIDQRKESRKQSVVKVERRSKPEEELSGNLGSENLNGVVNPLPEAGNASHPLDVPKENLYRFQTSQQAAPCAPHPLEVPVKQQTTESESDLVKAHKDFSNRGETCEDLISSMLNESNSLDVPNGATEDPKRVEPSQQVAPSSCTLDFPLENKPHLLEPSVDLLSDQTTKPSLDICVEQTTKVAENPLEVPCAQSTESVNPLDFCSTKVIEPLLANPTNFIKRIRRDTHKVRKGWSPTAESPSHAKVQAKVEPVPHWGPLLLDNDISKGLEPIPIPVTTEMYDLERPREFEYVTELKPTPAMAATPGWHSPPPAPPCRGCKSSLRRDNPKRKISVHVKCICQLANREEDDRLDWMGSKMMGRLAYDDSGLLQLDPTHHVIVECNNRCPCRAKCPNKVTQRGIRIAVEVFKTQSRGFGLRTRQDIQRGTFVGLYLGEAKTRDEAEDAIDTSYQLAPRSAHDFSGGGDNQDPKSETSHEHDLVIDAREKANAMRFLNHSCDGNLAAYHVYVDTLAPSRLNIALFACKDIVMGEELSFDYTGGGVSHGGEECRCGSPFCRKLI